MRSLGLWVDSEGGFCTVKLKGLVGMYSAPVKHYFNFQLLWRVSLIFSSFAESLMNQRAYMQS